MPKNFVGESFIVAIISGIEKVWIRGGGEYHDFPSEFLSHCIEIFHWRTLWCFRKILLSKIFMHRRGASRFCRNFLSHMTETRSFVKEPFCFPEIFWYRKKFMDKRGHITISSRNFCLTVPKNFVGESFSVSLTSGPEKIWIKEGGGVYQDFPSKIFCLSAEKFCRGIVYCCYNFGYRKSLDKGGGGVSRFSVGIFVSLYWNISLENTLVLQKNSFIENFHA